MGKIDSKKIILFGISIVLFFIPFMWLSQGEMDIGGDSQRLYFYDPLSLLRSFSLYAIAPWGTGKIYFNQYFLVYLLELIVLKNILGSSTLIIDFFNGLKLSLSFIFMFLVIKELLGKSMKNISLGEFCGSIIGALFYTLSPSILDNLKFALITHDMVFVNPMVCYFLLRYLKTLNYKYLWVALFITIVFSPSFALFNPPLYAFYPLVLFFLFIYNSYILKKNIPWKGIIFFIGMFIGLHAFHIFPVINTFFDKGSEINRRTLESFSSRNVGLDYFNAIHSLSKISNYMLLPLEEKKMQWSLVIIPLLTIIGFFVIVKKQKSTIHEKKTITTIAVFFLITLYLVSANITNLGLHIYKMLFLIPGFGMFRNFFGVWQFVYIFFYALLVGMLVSSLLNRFKKKYVLLIFFFVVLLFIIRSQNLLNGKLIQVTARGSGNLRSTIKLNPEYEKMLNYINQIPNDGKVFHLPFTDFPYNLVAGENNGVYIGQSMVGFLESKNAYSGYPDIDPFSEALRFASNSNDYSLIQQIFSLLQIRYILYDSDKRISSIYFTTFPYGYSGVPASPSGALQFVKKLPVHLIKKYGSYSLYEVNKSNYLPKMYIPSKIYIYDTNSKYDKEYFSALSFFSKKTINQNDDLRVAFMDRKDCIKIIASQVCNKDYIIQNVNNVKVSFQKINPTKYTASIKNFNGPLLLVFQNSFSSQWKLYQNNNRVAKRSLDNYFQNQITELEPQKSTIDSNPFETSFLPMISNVKHVYINWYANGWYIMPKKDSMQFIVEMNGQIFFYYSLIISCATFIIFIIIGIRLFKK